MTWVDGDLETLSNGSGRRAAAILIVAHLIPGVAMAGLWLLGLLAIFDDRHWIPAWIALIFGVATVLGLFLRFGFWGTPATRGQGHGEDVLAGFSPRVGFGLGWLRWSMQIVLVVVVLIPGLMTWANVRGWHLLGTAELRGLPTRAAAIPVPDDWSLTDTAKSGTGVRQFLDGPTGPEPAGFFEQTFVVPASYAFDDLKRWLESPEWAKNPDGGDAFGAIARERCDSATTTCAVHLVPLPGEQPEYFVRARLDEPSYDGDDTEVEVRLDYRQYVTPDWEVSSKTVERAMEIPVLDAWTSDDIIASTTNNGETFTQFFGVPESFTRADLDAWLEGPRWTQAANGEPFGAIEVDTPCREVGPGELDRTYLCSAMVVGTERSSSDGPSSGPIESLSISLTPDNRLRINLERNG